MYPHSEGKIPPNIPGADSAANGLSRYKAKRVFSAEGKARTAIGQQARRAKEKAIKEEAQRAAQLSQTQEGLLQEDDVAMESTAVIPANVPGGEVIALISAISQPSQAPIEARALEDVLRTVNDEELHALGHAAKSGFKRSRWELAKVLTEAHNRSDTNGKRGRRPPGTLSFMGFCAAVNFPVKSAQTLVKNLRVVETFNPELLATAAREGIDVLKPKVIAVLQLIEEELWGLSNVPSEKIGKYLCRLAAAEGRAPSADPITAETKKPDEIETKDTDEVEEEEPDETEEEEPDEVEEEKPDPPAPPAVLDPTPKCYRFKAQELPRLEAALAIIRSCPSYATPDISEEELALMALEQFAAILEAKYAHPEGGTSV